MLLDPTMLCGVISAATDFMVRVLHSRMLFDPTHASSPFSRGWQSLWLVLEEAIRSHACSLEALECVRPIAFLSGVNYLSSFLP
jgi:hypothetical protein